MSDKFDSIIKSLENMSKDERFTDLFNSCRRRGHSISRSVYLANIGVQALENADRRGLEKDYREFEGSILLKT